MHVAGALGDQIVGYVQVKGVVWPTEEAANGNGGLSNVEHPRHDDAILHYSAGRREPNIHAPQYDLDDVTIIGRVSAELLRLRLERLPSRRNHPWQG
jgi:hypothetical protein